MTKFGEKIVGILKYVPYYFLFLAAASGYTQYANSYPEFEWWTIYSSVLIFICVISALGIWYEQKWSIFVVALVAITTTYFQFFMNRPSYFNFIIFGLILWAQFEFFFLNKTDEMHNHEQQ